MREIKFRAWLSEQMWIVSSIELWNEPVLKWSNFSHENEFEEAPLKLHLIQTYKKDKKRILNQQDYIYNDKFPLYKDFHLMEGLGWEDKNKKHIFEKDIVKLYDEKENGVERIGIIERKNQWKELYCTGDPARSRYVQFYLDPIYTKISEVIGNIYENPELLKD